MSMQLTYSRSFEAGSCNCCDDHITERGMTEHAVAILTAGYDSHTASLRFCDKCLANLKTLVVGAIDPSPPIPEEDIKC